MPIVGDSSTITFDPARASNYSHSTIYITTASTPGFQNAPQLTNYWTAPSQCVDRWMAKSIQVATTIVKFMPTGGHTQTGKPIGLVTITSAVRERTNAVQSTALSYVPLDMSQSFRERPNAAFVAFSTNPGIPNSDTIYDPSYSSCQPYGSPNSYSPGICPDRYTMAEITEFHRIVTSNSTETYFQGSCCRSGMTFGPEWERACISNISTSFKIYASFTTTLAEGYLPITAYEYPARWFVSSGYGSDGYNTTTFSNISTVTSGLIAADPIVVGWQQKDLNAFPTEYVSSLAQRYNSDWHNIAGSAPPTPANTPSIPRNTSKPTEKLGTSARAGIGVGVSVGVVSIIAVLVILLVRKRRSTQTNEDHEGVAVPEVGDQEKKEMSAESKPLELDHQGVLEMSGEHKPHELDSRTVTVIPGPPTELDVS